MTENCNIIDLLFPYNTEYKKIRLGRNRDGGYVISEMFLQQSSALFTYGVGRDISFDIEFLDRTNKPVFLFDHTIKIIPNLYEGMSYFKEGLGIDTENCNDFINHYNENNIFGPVLLKIDIEGAEYSYLQKCNFDMISNLTTGIIVEFHNIDKQKNRSALLYILRKLKEYFILNHIHPNNSGGRKFLYKDDKIEIQKFPIAVECTFVNKKFINNISPDIRQYPVKDLDFPCSLNRIDLEIDFPNIWEQLNKKV